MTYQSVDAATEVSGALASVEALPGRRYARLVGSHDLAARALAVGAAGILTIGVAACSSPTGGGAVGPVVTASDTSASPAGSASVAATASPAAATASPAAVTVSAEAAASADPPTLATVGALFPASLASSHTCTAGVLDSPSGNVIVTAAHCVAGSGLGLVFVPGYDDGSAPYGSWAVTKAYAASGWISSQDPELDYVFLVVAPLSTNSTAASVQAVTGGNALGAAPGAGQKVTVAGYLIGRDDRPVICTAPAYLTGGYPTFDCAGYAGGTSGAPWIVGYEPSTGAGTITAVIGGLNQGGCSPGISYSAPFTAAVRQVFARAVAGGPADSLPVPGPVAC